MPASLHCVIASQYRSTQSTYLSSSKGARLSSDGVSHLISELCCDWWTVLFANARNIWKLCCLQVLDLRTSPASLASSLPSATLVASPDCSVICDDKDFFKLVNFDIIRLLEYLVCLQPSTSGVGRNEPPEGCGFGKAEGARQLPSPSKALGHFLREKNLLNI